MREGESCFAGLAEHHSTHRLVFLNYAKLHSQTVCCIYEPTVVAHVILVPRLKNPPQHTHTHIQPTHTYAHLSNVVRGQREGAPAQTVL